METVPAEYKGHRIHDQIEVNVKFPIDPKAKNPHDLIKVMTNNFVYQLKAAKEIINDCATKNDDLIGTVLQIIKPVTPQHSEGNAILTKIHSHMRMKFEVWQNGSKQWYKFDDIKGLDKETEEALMTIEYPEHQLICDQYKEAISEATEDMKERSKKEVEELFNQKTYPTDQKTSAEMFELMADIYSKQSTSTGVEPMMIGRSWNISGNPSKIDISANYTKDQSATIKKALALLAEQKQSEIKEIEELIKKL